MDERPRLKSFTQLKAVDQTMEQMCFELHTTRLKMFYGHTKLVFFFIWVKTHNNNKLNELYIINMCFYCLLNFLSYYNVLLTACFTGEKFRTQFVSNMICTQFGCLYICIYSFYEKCYFLYEINNPTFASFWFLDSSL